MSKRNTMGNDFTIASYNETNATIDNNPLIVIFVGHDGGLCFESVVYNLYGDI